MKLLDSKEVTAKKADDPALRTGGDTAFQQAFEAARRRYDDEAWAGLSPRERTTAIYQEIRQQDAARAPHGRARGPDAD